MTKEEIAHLARLSRVALTSAELDSFHGQISSILEYVSTVNAIAALDQPEEPEVGKVHNVFRADCVTVPPGSYTEVLLAAMPAREGQFLKVKKILSHDE
jgi:aspartyl-tRNA(Asn)/glutamyl-tRNA(Gln) amidotransferase subunit C